MAASALALLLLVAQPAPVPMRAEATARGIVVSTHGSGADWASERIEQAVDDAAGLGATWICVHPYARIGDDGSVRGRLQRATGREEIARPVRAAHARGLRAFLKPHLAYWGSGFGWRGDIAFADDEARWRRFFTDYRAWIVAVAEVAAEAGADAFAVGTELDRTLHREDDWRAVIAAVRARFPGALTYAANWTDYARVPFWDALDCIGVQAYFPLVGERVAAPTRADLDAGWARRMGELAAFARAQHRRVAFTELGYDRSLRAAHEPWVSRRDGEAAEPLQVECLRAALATIERERELICGVFLWKWFPPPRRAGRDFGLAAPAMAAAVREAWR